MAGMTPVENSGNKLLGSGRRKARTLDDVDKSLACFTRALQGSPVIVELRNATFVRGTLYMSDTCMNMFLSDVKMTRELARMIRMIHLPAEMDFKAFLLQERKEVAASHAQRKVSLLSKTSIETMPESTRDAARPAGF